MNKCFCIFYDGFGKETSKVYQKTRNRQITYYRPPLH